MICNEAAEFVSALCDGETIPPDAAMHIGECNACGERLAEYMSMGAELRRLASLVPMEAAPERVWQNHNGRLAKLWNKGWEAMRIPKFAFVAMTIGLIAASSSLVVVGARAHNTDTVVLLKIARPGASSVNCALSTVDRKNVVCAYAMKINSGLLIYQMKFLSREGERVQLAVQSKFTPVVGLNWSMSPDDFVGLPEQHYSFEPGETLQAEVAGFGKLPVTGEWTDHVPSLALEKHDLDPEPNQLRIMSPILLRGKEVVGDMEGGSAIEDEGRDVVIYLPGQGRFSFSVAHVEGAVEGEVALNRIKFQSDGEQYTLVTAAPITRNGVVWVVRDPSYQPSKEAGRDTGFIGTGDLQPEAGGSANDSSAQQ